MARRSVKDLTKKLHEDEAMLGTVLDSAAVWKLVAPVAGFQDAGVSGGYRQQAEKLLIFKGAMSSARPPVTSKRHRAGNVGIGNRSYRKVDRVLNQFNSDRTKAANNAKDKASRINDWFSLDLKFLKKPPARSHGCCARPGCANASTKPMISREAFE